MRNSFAKVLAKNVNALFAISSLGVVLALVIYFRSTGSFSNEGFMPHGHCYLWTPALLWTMVMSDSLIGLAYLSISICLYILVRRIKLPFSTMFLAFGAFIAACGGTHFMKIYTLWYPNYWMEAGLKVITALASVATAAIMFPLFPRVLKFAASARLSEERKLQLEAANVELERRGAELSALNSELEAFSYSVAHDLRSPLRGINGFSTALKEDYASKLDNQGQQYLEYITAGSQKMGIIIDDLLNLSKITRQVMYRTTVDMSLLANEVAGQLKALEPERRVEFSIEEGVFASGDSGLLKIVLTNLMSNAWKFTSRSFGARIEFGVKSGGSSKVYFVRDNGVGLDMNFAHKLFTPFQRLHAAEDFEGTGVGLATIKRILTKHGGDIWVESEVGKGSTFYFTIGSQ